jgi:phosphoribosyl 1,2-cyclic phosphate phosphodiesterase
MMSYRLTILGCGSSGGVPRVGNDWGKCDPANPKNRRRRCSALIERRGPGGVTSVLVDTGPDLREQLLSVRLQQLDAVLYTHDHADHTHGIDDLRNLVYLNRRRVPAYLDTATRTSLEARFGYCFKGKEQQNYPAIVDAREIEAGQPVAITGKGGVVDALAIRQEHGEIGSLGFRFGCVAYSPDVSGLSDEAARALSGLDVWIVDALRHTPHPSHFTVKQALAWIERLRPKRAILTHLHVDLDYDALVRELPSGVEPAYDGMQISW